MINLSELLDRAKKKALEKPDNKDGYAPKSTDELRFKRKHVHVTEPDANKNGDDVFKGTSVKAVDRAGTRFGYNPGQDEEVYEEVKKKKVCEAKTRMPLDGHPYHNKSDAELKYIIKDAGEAAQAMRGQDSKAENKYLDQVNDASTILAYRQKLQNEEIYEEKGQYKKMAMAHKNRASEALEANDHESFHHHLANYHESMGKWHESKGRHSAADREYDRAAFHTDFSAFYANPEKYRKNFEKEKGD
jgi:hypothetical protein